MFAIAWSHCINGMTFIFTFMFAQTNPRDKELQWLLVTWFINRCSCSTQLTHYPQMNLAMILYRQFSADSSDWLIFKSFSQCCLEMNANHLLKESSHIPHAYIQSVTVTHLKSIMITISSQWINIHKWKFNTQYKVQISKNGSSLMTAFINHESTKLVNLWATSSKL